MWITIHDPKVIAYNGYEKGDIPPSVSDKHGSSVYIAAHNLLRAHAAAYKTYDTMYRDKQNGKYIVSLKMYYMKSQSHRFNVS